MKTLKIALGFFCFALLLIVDSCKKDPKNSTAVISFCDTAHCVNAVCDSATKTCRCNYGYEGPGCNTITREFYFGTYYGHHTCGTNIYPDSLQISAGTYPAPSVQLKCQYFNLNGSISNHALLVPPQVLGPVTESGTGFFSGDTVTFNYLLDNSSGVKDTCTFWGVR